MTDASAARAHPPGPDEPQDDAASDAVDTTTSRYGDAFAPAAHGHPPGAAGVPDVSSSRTAVLESAPPFGFPRRAAAPRAAASAVEPPPFGFNAPRSDEAAAEEEEATLRGAPAAATPPAAAASGPGGAPAAGPAPTTTPLAAEAPSPTSAPAWAPPAWAGTPTRPAMPPRELMPPVVPVARNRIGETPTPTFGPPGRSRSVAAMVVLSVLTLGFYAVGWHRRVNQEMADFDPRIQSRPSRSAWAVALPLLIGLLASAAAGARIALDHYGFSVHVPVTVAQATFGLGALLAVPYLVLFLPFSVIAVAMTAERVRLVEEHAGMAGDEQIRPAGVVGWLLLPVFGGFVAMGRQQAALNRIWDLARE